MGISTLYYRCVWGNGVKMEIIKDTLKDVIQDLKIKKKDLRIDEFGSLLKKTLTKKELNHIKLGYFRNGILGINVDSSVWLYHLNLKKEVLLTKLNKKIAIKDIRLHLGE